MNAVPAIAALPTLSDRELVAAVRNGDDSAFEELYRRYRGPVWNHVYGAVKDRQRAEDLTQETFFSALRRLQATDSDIAFKAWILQIARNACIDVFRRESRVSELSIDVDDELRPADRYRPAASDPPEAVVHRERLNHLQGAFDELSENHHRILVMRELEGRSYSEIAQRMELTHPAVESTLFRARRRLHDEYKQLDTGARCAAMGTAMARQTSGVESASERRKLGRHLRRCTSCRRRARELGLNVQIQPTARSKAAALFPLPAILGKFGRGGGAAPAHTPAHGRGLQEALTNWLPTGADGTTASVGKAVALVASVVAIGGGGAAVYQTTDASTVEPSGAGQVRGSDSPVGLEARGPWWLAGASSLSPSRGRDEQDATGDYDRRALDSRGEGHARPDGSGGAAAQFPSGPPDAASAPGSAGSPAGSGTLDAESRRLNPANGLPSAPSLPNPSARRLSSKPGRLHSAPAGPLLRSLSNGVLRLPGTPGSSKEGVDSLKKGAGETVGGAIPALPGGIQGALDALPTQGLGQGVQQDLDLGHGVNDLNAVDPDPLALLNP